MSLAALRAELAGEPAPVVVEEPMGVARVVTPSGLKIYYQAAPKRLYRIRKPVGLSEGMWEYGEWTEVPSVSTVLEVLEKGGLSWWGQGVGVAGVQKLLEIGELTWVES